MKDLLRALARPRLTGSKGAQEVADIIHERLTELGYEIQDHPFTFSTWPGRFAMSIAGLIFLAGTLGAAALLNMRHPGMSLVILSVALLIVAAITVLTPVVTNILPFGRITANNMFAARPKAIPRFIFMAHLDSKSQPVPLAFRGPAIILALLAWLAFAIFATLALLDPVYIRPEITTLLGVIAFIAGVLLVFCWVENRSPGALDNASGVATVLALAESEKDRDDVAFLITDAEELGLVGARSIARKLNPVFGVINIDGVDDSGPIYVLEKFGVPPRHIAPHLVAAILSAADAQQIPAQRRNVPFGLMVDHLPIARADLPAVTVMRGSFASLRRVHRPADNMDRMSGTGIETVANVLRDALARLREDAATTMRAVKGAAAAVRKSSEAERSRL
ncbi:MAG TPA: M28 family peptidase [Longimicrobiales bacterium]